MIKENFLTSAFTLLFHYFLLQVLLFMVYQLPETEHWKSFAIWSAFGRDANFFSVMLFHFFFFPPLNKRTSFRSPVQANPLLECFKVWNEKFLIPFLVEIAARYLYLGCTLKLSWYGAMKWDVLYVEKD